MRKRTMAKGFICIIILFLSFYFIYEHAMKEREEQKKELETYDYSFLNDLNGYWFTSEEEVLYDHITIKEVDNNKMKMDLSLYRLLNFEDLDVVMERRKGTFKDENGIIEGTIEIKEKSIKLKLTKFGGYAGAVYEFDYHRKPYDITKFCNTYRNGTSEVTISENSKYKNLYRINLKDNNTDIYNSYVTIYGNKAVIYADNTNDDNKDQGIGTIKFTKNKITIMINEITYEFDVI